MDKDNAAPSRDEKTTEVLVFLFLIVPSIVLSLFATGATRAGFVLLALNTIFRDLALVALVLFFLWRNGEPRAKIGWTHRTVGRELVLGLLLFPFVFTGSALLGSLLQSLGLSGPSEQATSALRPDGTPQLLLALLLVSVVAVAEETIFRGYLITRVTTITSNLPFSIAFSTFVFSLGHGYEGSAGLITVGALGLVFALVFVWRKSLVAPMVMHFLNNFVALVLVPLFGGF